ncbi:hypothetical protein HL653_02625 [Sphingomonas sp. AP4-R1]|uniref:hypothetical protein n=1 Tax=Sphingomonas sp. AP4-R1 TaxID=2735134 RepID=UPI001493A6B7|nr:hypothetical protein [Sphingomonas sp. AP4-R1]QJU56829.1 hypothetical protein HL653_02625 [Sphingomonas sp. AP4-R1]
MILTVMAATVALAFVLLALAFIGRISFVRAIAENERRAQTVADFHSELVIYANSQGADQAAFRRLSMQSTALEAALGWDNIVSGVRIGMYMLNGARLFPLALQEMRREYGDGIGWRDRGGEIADAAQTVLFRHLGRRLERSEALNEKAGKLGTCIARGWSAVSSLPLSILAAFGLLKPSRAEAARASVIFKLWNLALALAAISGPVFAYLADREKIDAAVKSILP